MTLTIYHKDGTAFGELKAFEFSSEHMGDSKITATIYSPDKIDFAIKDYVVFRDAQFYIAKKPSALKTKKTGVNIGNAIQYDLEFYAPYRVLKDINFEDWVTENDSGQYYTGEPNFYFYNTVQELADRIQANLDRFVGDGIWNVFVSEEETDLAEMQISINEISVWDGLLMVNSQYGLNFFISGTTIQIGGTLGNLDTILYYGKNLGLYEIDRSFQEDVKVITRLKVYGSERNLPPDYLRDENKKGRYFTKLMLPDFAATGIDYVDAPVELIEEYGIIEGVKGFDVYPSIEEIDLGSGRIDEIVSVEAIDLDSDFFYIQTRDLEFDINNYILSGDTPRISIKGTNSDGTPTYLGGYEFTIIQVVGTRVKLQKFQEGNIIVPDDVSTVRAGDRFVLLGIEMPQVYITNAENKLDIKAREYFSEGGSPELMYTIKVDEKFTELQGIADDFVVGKKIMINDNDLEVANYFTTQQVNIAWEEGKILPTYDIQLSNIKLKTLKDEIKKNTAALNNTNTAINNKFVQTNNSVIVNQTANKLIWK